MIRLIQLFVMYCYGMISYQLGLMLIFDDIPVNFSSKSLLVILLVPFILYAISEVKKEYHKEIDRYFENFRG